MSAQPTEAPIEMAPAAAAPPADRPAWIDSLAVAIPGGILLLIFFLCFVWPLIGPVPKPTGGNILDSSLPIVLAGPRPGHGRRSATTSGRACCTAGATRC